MSTSKTIFFSQCHSFKLNAFLSAILLHFNKQKTKFIGIYMRIYTLRNSNQLGLTPGFYVAK